MIMCPFITGIFILNFFACAACTHANGDKTLISLAFGLSVFMVVMVSSANIAVYVYLLGLEWSGWMDCVDCCT